MSLNILIAAGGTGGHMIPAHALDEELQQRGHRTILLTDNRGMRFPGLFENTERHILKSATASGAHPLAWGKALARIWQGRREGRRIARDVAADAVVGFGGYPSLPGILAGISLGLPAIIHEQNAVLGRVNRHLGNRVSAIALTYPETARIGYGWQGKTTLTGNPVRKAILAVRHKDFAAPAPDAPFEILVIGGSQGARILSNLVPDAVALLPEALRQRLVIAQQCRPEDLSDVVRRYEKSGVTTQCETYMTDMPERLARAHLVISRAGASTMAELMAVGRPAILIPFKAATDDHQTANALGYVSAGAGIALAERDATLPRLSGAIAGFIRSPEALTGAAAAARKLGRPDAASKLADLVEHEVRKFGGAA